VSLGSLYSGVGASLLLTINPAIQYTCFEQMRQRVIGSLSARAGLWHFSQRYVAVNTPVEDSQ
jgi:hypothetical protein